jgi:hypothetical protein
MPAKRTKRRFVPAESIVNEIFRFVKSTSLLALMIFQHMLAQLFHFTGKFTTQDLQGTRSVMGLAEGITLPLPG